MYDLRMYICTVHDSVSGSIDRIILIGIVNRSISHDLYLRNCMSVANHLKHIRIMPLPTSYFMDIVYLHSYRLILVMKVL